MTTNPSVRAFRRLALIAVLAWAGCARAERLFVGVMEADSYRSVIYGASAFSRIADLPIVLESVNTLLLQNLATPSFSGISPADTLRLFQTVDTEQPLSGENPANVAIIPLTDSGTLATESFAAAYAARAKEGPILRFEQPRDTNLPARVCVAFTERHMMTSTSPDAIKWVWTNRLRLTEAPPQDQSGTLRILVNPQRLADVLGTRSEKTEAFLNLDKLLRDFETLSFSITLDGQALTLMVHGKPAAGSGLQSLHKALRPPARRLWNGLPDNALFSSVSACDSPKLWDAYLGQQRLLLMRPITRLVPDTATTGDRLLYLVPPKTRPGLCFVQIEPVKDAQAVRLAIQKLDTVKTDDGVTLTRRPSRQLAQLRVESYDVVLRPATHAQAGSEGKADDVSLVYTLASLFLKHAVLETGVVKDHLITVLGPENVLEEQLPNLAFADKPLTLNRVIGTQTQLSDDNLFAGAFLGSANLLRQVVATMPGVKPEHLRVFPTGGDGATFAFGQSDPQTLTATLRLHTNEIAALQRINTNGREVLQELFFQMFLSQLMDFRTEQTETSPAKQ